MKKLVAVLAVAVVGAGVLAVYLWQDLRAEREQNRQLAARAAEVTVPAPAAALPPPLPVAPEPVAPATVAAVSAPETKPVPEAASQPAAQPAQQPANANANPLAAMLANPGAKDMVRTMMRGMMEQMYPDLAEELGLTTAEAEQLMDLLAKHQGDLSADSLDMLAGGGDPAAMQQTQRKLLEQQRANEAEVAAMLGSRYPKWEEYQATATARQQVQQLGTVLGAAGKPLSEAQTLSLTTALAAENGRLMKEERDWSESGAAQNSSNMLAESLQRAAESQRRSVDVAAGHLDAEQLALYRRQVEQTISMTNAMSGLLGGQGAGPGQAGAMPQGGAR